MAFAPIVPRIPEGREHYSHFIDGGTVFAAVMDVLSWMPTK